MNNFVSSFSQEDRKAFRHIYVEEQILELPLTQKILSQFPSARQIRITSYLEIFHRRRQDFMAQKQEPSLILARREEPLIFPGAPVCQSFGSTNFYYTSCFMNCLFDCEYCYLQGMYPSANPVIFVNLEDFFNETKRLAAKHPVYLCISYDSDLFALEGLLSYCKQWLMFTAKEPELTIELRTKCGLNRNLTALLAAAEQLPEPVRSSVKKRFIFAFTLSPEEIQTRFEHRTGTLKARLAAASAAANSGFAVRLCFDPLIYTPEYKKQYKKLADEVREALPAEQIRDISLGPFRVSGDFLKQMRKQRPLSPVLQFPYRQKLGVFSYEPALEQKLLHTMAVALEGYLPSSKIYVWEQERPKGKEL